MSQIIKGKPLCHTSYLLGNSSNQDYPPSCISTDCNTKTVAKVTSVLVYLLTKSCTYETFRQTDRQTDADGQTDGQMQMDRQTK